MDDEQVLLENSIHEFFERSCLTFQDQVDCVKYVQHLYPLSRICASPSQGYCSLTILVDDDKVVQFRPHGYRLELKITHAAREVYGSFAPVTKYIGMIPTSHLLVYGMERIRGISFRDFRVRTLPTAVHLGRLCTDFAVFLSHAWKHKSNGRIIRGRVGKSIKPRLESLMAKLPHRFRSTVWQIAQNFDRIEALPWVLTHGDIVAANIMVDPTSCRLLGLVDWAEAESLPFGVCLYGLEEILGCVTLSTFQYYPDASALRDIFWAELIRLIPELQQSDVLKTVKLARAVGVLLWHGIAFDDGAHDRVVVEGRDDEEICRLDAFLDVSKNERPSKSSKL